MSTTGPDQFDLSDRKEFSAEHERISEYLFQVQSQGAKAAAKSDAYRDLVESDDKAALPLALAMLVRTNWLARVMQPEFKSEWNPSFVDYYFSLLSPIEELLRRDLPFDSRFLTELAGHVRFQLVGGEALDAVFNVIDVVAKKMEAFDGSQTRLINLVREQYEDDSSAATKGSDTYNKLVRLDQITEGGIYDDCERTGPDRFVLKPGNPNREAHEALSKYLESDFGNWKVAEIKRKPLMKDVLSRKPNERAAYTSILVERMAPLSSRTGTGTDCCYITLAHTMRMVIQSAGALDDSQLNEILFLANQNEQWAEFVPVVIERLNKQLEKGQPIDNIQKTALRRLLEMFDEKHWDRKDLDAKVGARIKKLIGVQPKENLAQAGKEIGLYPGEPWANAAISYLIEVKFKQEWMDLFDHCKKTCVQSPTKSWKINTPKFIDAVGRDEFLTKLTEWCELVESVNKADVDRMDNSAYNWNPQMLRSLIFCTGLIDDESSAQMLGRLAAFCGKPHSIAGARLEPVAFACLSALGQLSGRAAIRELVGLKGKITLGSVRYQLERRLESIADKEETSLDEMVEEGVPDFGLTDVGLLREEIGDATTEISIDSGQVNFRWFKADGKEVKTPPASIKKSHEGRIKELKKSVKEIRAALSTHTSRIDRNMINRPSWDLATWRKHYLDHPLIGCISRRLIWKFEFDGKKSPVVGFYLIDKFVDANNKPLKSVDNATAVRLWHPIEESLDDCLAWRRFVVDHEITQPFKQAHREVYVLTEAEKKTEVYSNRFAGQFLNQHQFKALCISRDWKYRLRMIFEGAYPPATKIVPAHGLRAEFLLGQVGDDIDHDANLTGTMHIVGTDQVRFFKHDSKKKKTDNGDEALNPLPLTDIPPLVFSEIMRDVDLFVGVAGIGNNPSWEDSGEMGYFYDHWVSNSFGELTELARTRRQVIEDLLPRLRIADRCKLEGRFLNVQGNSRLYKIHLGSGNILMSPDDQYLCIVPSQLAGDSRVLLPFEGDRALSIILSKAFLLAGDDKIKDSSIRSQINRN